MQMQVLFPFSGNNFKFIGSLATLQGDETKMTEETSDLGLSSVCGFVWNNWTEAQILSFICSALINTMNKKARNIMRGP